MVSRGNVYVETTVLSYLAARPSRDLRVAAHQQITAEWWETRRGEFRLFISQLVVEEASAGDPAAAARRMKFVADLDLLELSDAALQLAEGLLTDGAVPPVASEDALHRDRGCPRDALPDDLELQAYRKCCHQKPNRTFMQCRRIRDAGDLHTGRTFGGLAPCGPTK